MKFMIHLMMLMISINAFQLRNMRFRCNRNIKMSDYESDDYYSSLSSIIQEQPGSPPSFMTSNDGSIGKVLDQKWRCGFCNQKTIFEASNTIRRLHLLGDLLALSLLSGQTFVIRISTSEILDRFNAHTCEVTALDFDGLTFVSASADGQIASHQLKYSSSNMMGEEDFVIQYAHERAITGLKIVTTRTGDKPLSKGHIISCSIDQTVKSHDLDDGKLRYTLPLGEGK